MLIEFPDRGWFGSYVIWKLRPHFSNLVARLRGKQYTLEETFE